MTTQHTAFGFDYGHLRCERMGCRDGVTIVRITNRVTGQFVDVQTSSKGRKQYMSVGTLKKDALARWLEDGE